MLTQPLRLVIAILLLSVLWSQPCQPAVHAASGSLSTTFVGGNNRDGVMFDVAPSVDIAITSFDLVGSANSTSNTMEIYYKVGTYAGFEANSGAWTLHHSAPLTTTGGVVNYPLPIPLALTGGTTYGIYLTFNGNNSLSNMTYSTNESTFYSNSELSITLGAGLDYPFTNNGNPVFSPRTWNGTIYYTFGPPDTATPSPTPTGTLSSTPNPTATLTPTPTATATDTPTDIPTHTATHTSTSMATHTFTPSVTPSSTLTTCAMVATAPSLLSPVHRAHTTDTTPNFRWNAVAGAQSYRLMVYLEDRSFEYKKRVFVTSYTLTAGEALTPAKYLWRVRTQDTTCSTWTGWSQRNTLFVD